MKLLYLATFLLVGTTVTQAQIWGLNNSRTDWRNNAGLQGNAGAVSGFYQTENPVNYPAGATSWWHLLDVRHDNPVNNYAMQFAGGFFDQNLYFRKTNDNPSQAWSKVLLSTDGKVGIGINSPSAVLHLATGGTSSNATAQYSGDLIIQGNSGARSFNSGASLEFVIPANTDGGNPWGQARIITIAGNANNGDATGKLIMGTRRMFDKQVGTGLNWNYGDDLVIDGTGNIGIGTTTPDAKLAVKGTIHTKEVKVDMNGWADYVFSSTYRLPTLKVIEAFINKNKHLPEMPSAQEVVKDGINLGKMNMLMVKKVEELTLYIIEQSNQLREQQKEISEKDQQIKKFESRLNTIEQVLKKATNQH